MNGKFVNKINIYNYSEMVLRADTVLTIHNYTQALKTWVDSDLCQRNLEGI